MSDDFPADKDWEEVKFRARVWRNDRSAERGAVEWAMHQLNVSRSMFRLVKQFRQDGDLCIAPGYM